MATDKITGESEPRHPLGNMLKNNISYFNARFHISSRVEKLRKRMGVETFAESL